MFCQPQFGFPRKMPVEYEPAIEMGEWPTGFPHNIETYLWTHQGSPGGDAWHALGKMNSGAWFYFFAKCPESEKPFISGCGCIHVYAAWNFENLILHAMDQDGYELYLKESRDQTDANTQMSHQASDASGLSEGAGPQAPYAQFLERWLRAPEPEYKAAHPDSADLSESPESLSSRTEGDKEQSDASHPPDHLDS
jgi:hypothetical protein